MLEVATFPAASADCTNQLINVAGGKVVMVSRWLVTSVDVLTVNVMVVDGMGRYQPVAKLSAGSLVFSSSQFSGSAITDCFITFAWWTGRSCG